MFVYRRLGVRYLENFILQLYNPVGISLRLYNNMKLIQCTGGGGGGGGGIS